MESKKKYCNPVSFTDGRRHTNPDPYVLRWCGKYYCYATDEFGVKVSVSADMVCWEDRGYAISEKEYHNYWAPAVIYQNGLFYMYYSNIAAKEQDCHEEHLKLAVSTNPEGEFKWKKTFFDKFSIDAHPIMWKGRLYLFYSVNDWVGTEKKIAGTCILVDEMKSPEELAGNPKAVVLPGIRQEIYAENRFGDGRDWYTIEGAAPVIRGNRFWILYSANAYVNVDYYIGMAIAESRENLLDMVWQKYPKDYIWYPLLRKNDSVEGTGHNTVVKAPNMVDEWIVYHGRNAKEELKPETEQREMYIDALYFNGDEILCYGPTADWEEAPGKPEVQIWNRDITGRSRLGGSGLYYQMELWISASHSHTGARYGIMLSYQDEANYLEVQINTGRKELAIISVQNGIHSVTLRAKIKKDYDYTVPHLIQVWRAFDNYTILLDEDQEIHFLEYMSEECGSIEILPYYTEMTLHSFALTRTVMLRGKELKNFGRMYQVSSCKASETGLVASDGKLVLEKRECDEEYTEIFLLQILDVDNEIALRTGTSLQVLTQRKETEFSLYHIVRKNEEKFLIDGERKTLTKEEKLFEQLVFCGLKIAEYQYTKNEIK